MNETAGRPWEHSHTFGQDVRRPGESRTLLVIAITAAMMVVEIAAGIAFGSMALLADGLHMASHAAALGINAFAYVYARRHAHDASFSFGTGKINTLGGFTGAVLLAGFALLMATESVERLISPVGIAFNQAIAVAVLGLLVNGASMWILGGHAHTEALGHDHGHADHRHGPEGHDHDDHDHHDHHDHDHDHHHDHNLASAYLHVLADALTSLLAIFALLGAKYFGFNWMDPLMGIVGALLVARWSFGLLRSTSGVLLDRAAPAEVCAAVRAAIEQGGAQGENAVVTDLHVWAVGPNLYSAALTVVAAEPVAPDVYRALLPPVIVHATIEVHAAPAAAKRGSAAS
jgi:cation diffusion facilitator family transporter